MKIKTIAKRCSDVLMRFNDITSISYDNDTVYFDTAVRTNRLSPQTKQAIIDLMFGINWKPYKFSIRYVGKVKPL